MARKQVAQLEVWKRLSDAIRELEALRTRLTPEGSRTPTAEAKVIRDPRLGQDLHARRTAAVERGTPIKCFTTGLREEMIKQAMLSVDEGS